MTGDASSTPRPGWEVVIRHQRLADGYSDLRVRINERGDLVLDGADGGQWVKEWWGDFDYEYLVTVPAAWTGKVLEHLAREFGVSVPPKWKEKTLLHLVKARFNDTSSFRAWCAERDIPAKFNSWV